MINKIGWYLGKLVNFLWASLNICLYLILHPNQFKKFFFIIFSDINEFHQMAFGGLKNFEETTFLNSFPVI